MLGITACQVRTRAETLVTRDGHHSISRHTEPMTAQLRMQTLYIQVVLLADLWTIVFVVTKLAIKGGNVLTSSVSNAIKWDTLRPDALNWCRETIKPGGNWSGYTSFGQSITAKTQAEDGDHRAD